jgi:phosphatidylinositol 4-kinase type 2
MMLIDHVKRGFDLGFAPQLAMEGTGGTYFMRNESKRIVACFKPMDEEPFAMNNPKSLVGTPGSNVQMKNGIKAGEGFVREVAAFIFVSV